MSEVPILVSVEWLKERLDAKDGNLVIVDASYDMQRDVEAAYSLVHITGALFFDLKECRSKSSPYRNMLPSPVEFAKFVGNLGIDNFKHVVVYDDSQRGIFGAARVWWMLRTFGHDKVSVLNGGLTAWMEHQFPVSTEIRSVTPRLFRASLKKDYIKSFEDVVLVARGTTSGVLVDARPLPLFAAGRPMKAKNLSYAAVLKDLPLTTLKDEEDLEKVFQSAGVDFTQPVIFHCSSGIAACSLFLAASVLGKRAPDIAVYDGSWSEWEVRAKGIPGLLEYEHH